ncbi:MAG: hypothetical protein IKS41_06060 [Alphaproteobacteria bacterium]|nr:hypothetical protein [Alphaproteobacteria bacterium]
MEKLNTMKQRILNFNLESFIVNLWKKIPTIEKKAFLWIFILSNLVFLFHSVTFFWGDHDWREVVKRGEASFRIGRFFAGFPLLPFNKDILPIFNNLYSFCGFSLAVIYLAKYWKASRTVFSYTIFGLFIILMPYTLSWMWYIYMTPNFWLLFFIFYGLYQVQRDKIRNHLLLIALIFISLSCFQSIISTILIVFLGKCLLNVVIEDISFKTLIKENYKVGFDILVASVGYLGTFLYLKYIGKVESIDYHSQFITLSDLKSQVIKAFIAIRDEFWLASPYMSVWLKRILFITIMGAFFFCVRYKNMKKTSVSLSIIIGILLCSQITPFLSGEINFFRYMRINFYAFPYIYALSCVILLSQKQIFKSITLGVMIFATFYSALGDIRCQKVWYFSRGAEIRTYQEVIARIHVLPNFNSDKKYKVVLMGKIVLPRYFDRYNENAKNKVGEFNASFTSVTFLSFLNFMNGKKYIARYILSAKFTDKDILSLDTNYISNQAKPWPHKDSVAIIGDTIYIIMDKEELKRVQKRMKKLIKEQTQNKS